MASAASGMNLSSTSAAEPYARGMCGRFSIFLATADSIICRRPLSFHAVSFGRDAASSSLRRMAQIALDVQNSAPQDPLLPAAASVPSSYTEALDTVKINVLFYIQERLM